MWCSFSCVEQPLPAEPDGKLVYDLLPMDPTVGYCRAPLCAVAAAAIDAYRAFLHVFSHFRLTVVHSMIASQCPFAAADDGDQSTPPPLEPETVPCGLAAAAAAIGRSAL